MVFQLITVPIIGALIGWVTNVLAIKLIFRPYKPLIVPLINIKIQGLIPKRRQEIAANIGRVISDELLSFEDVMERLNETGLQRKLVNSMVQAITDRLEERIPAIVPGTLKKVLLNLVEDTFRKEAPSMIKKMIRELPEKIEDELDFAEMVEDKLNSFDLAQLEKVVLQIASRELRHIEILGGVLGFLIGLFQAAIAYFWFYV